VPRVATTAIFHSTRDFSQVRGVKLIFGDGQQVDDIACTIGGDRRLLRFRSTHLVDERILHDLHQPAPKCTSRPISVELTHRLLERCVQEVVTIGAIARESERAAPQVRYEVN
jgi:hypothetical protein